MVESVPYESPNNYFYEEENIYNKSEVAAFLPELVCGVCNYILKALILECFFYRLWK